MWGCCSKIITWWKSMLRGTQISGYTHIYTFAQPQLLRKWCHDIHWLKRIWRVQYITRFVGKLYNVRMLLNMMYLPPPWQHPLSHVNLLAPQHSQWWCPAWDCLKHLLKSLAVLWRPSIFNGDLWNVCCPAVYCYVRGTTSANIEGVQFKFPPNPPTISWTHPHHEIASSRMCRRSCTPMNTHDGILHSWVPAGFFCLWCY